MSARRTWLRSAALLLVCGLAFSPSLDGQGRTRGRQRVEEFPNAEYDGRFVFARIAYSEPQSFGRGRGGGAPWSHDYPRGERNFLKILQELTSVGVRSDASTILTTDNPELYRFPVAYMAEPGFWRPSEAEVVGMRTYLQKGGFFIFDDFVGNHWFNFESQLQRVLPGAQLVVLDASHPIFDAFYRIASLDFNHPLQGVPSVFYGVFEDNDPTKRLLLIANYNNDLSEYWEFSDVGYFPIDLSNEAYKLGINYIVYALSR